MGDIYVGSVSGCLGTCSWIRFLTWDRLLALEIGKPVSINDQDCDVDLPCPIVDERYISDGILPDSQQTTPFLAAIHVVRSIGQLTRTLRCPTIAPATLETFERHFDACMGTFPASYHPRSDQPLDPRSLAPIVYLQNARLILHRHNISPMSPADARSISLDHCISAALDTATLLSRCLQHPLPGGEDGLAVFASAATTILCMHIWRCTLFLLLRQEYAAALVCVQASSQIGDLRAINAFCGRYLAFFVRFLLDRMRRPGPPVDLSRDEELIAYVSGDMQGSSDGSWVWQGSEMGSQLEVLSSPVNSSPIARPETGNDSMDWEGWEWIERTVQYLLSEQQQQQQERPQETQPQEPVKKEIYLSPDTATGEDIARRSSSSHSRMTIASII